MFQTTNQIMLKSLGPVINWDGVNSKILHICGARQGKQ